MVETRQVAELRLRIGAIAHPVALGIALCVLAYSVGPNGWLPVVAPGVAEVVRVTRG